MSTRNGLKGPGPVLLYRRNNRGSRFEDTAGLH
jgi:hypothetical protein